MEIQQPSRKLTYAKRKSYSWLAWLCFFVAIIVTVLIGYLKLAPSTQLIEAKYNYDYPIVINGELQEYGAHIENDDIKLPLPFVNSLLGDHPIHYEKESGTIVLTTMDKVIRFKQEHLDALVNEKPYNLTLTADVIEGEVYIPLQLINELYGLQANRSSQSNIVTVYSAGTSLDQAVIKREKGTYLRSDPSIKSSSYSILSLDEVVTVWSEEEDWLFVQDGNGQTGYIKKSLTQGSDPIQIPVIEKSEDFTHKLNDQKINLIWEAIYNQQPNLAGMPQMEGVNVVSPTWFELVDAEGNIQGKATHQYTEWAHNRGYEVWALFSNGFDPDMTHEVLSSVEKRFYMIQQILAFAELYHVQGINIDFENVYTKDKENLVQFMKELTPLLHEQGLVVSIDVTPKSNSELWSLFLDRESLGKIVDYMIIMAYDEHWASSPKAGSVASLPWVERSITRIIDEDGVPASKLILGMPLYTRLWSEEKQTDGSVKVSSKAIGMQRVQEILKEHQLEPKYDESTGQNYVEYMEGEIKQRIWIEDETSIAARIDLVHQYQLAGVASWQRAFHKPDIWPVIHNKLLKNP